MCKTNQEQNRPYIDWQTVNANHAKKARDYHVQVSCNALESLHVTLKGLKERLPGHNFPCSCKDYQRVLCMTVTVLEVCSVHLLYFDSYWLKNSSCKVICCCSKLSKASESQPILSSLEKINHNCKNFGSCILCLHLGVCCRWVLSRLVHLFL